MRIGIAQINTHVGAIESNTSKVLSIIESARDKEKCDLLVFPELVISGYPPEDLLFRNDMSSRINASIECLKSETKGISICIGFPEYKKDSIFNSALFISNGKELARHRKLILPNYSVFDEKRYFNPGKKVSVFDFKGIKFSTLICEDAWEDRTFDLACMQGANIVIIINASPFHIDKHSMREKIFSLKSRRNKVPVIYVNMIGGQDELVFDGASFVLDSGGDIIYRAARFSEQVSYIQIKNNHPVIEFNSDSLLSEPSSIKSIYDALVLGVRDYVKKNNFNHVVLGLSGGIDSALTLCVAHDALGKDKVKAVMMPSRFTSKISKEDSKLQAKILGVDFEEISIESIFQSILKSLKYIFSELDEDITEENIQARCRSIILMAISNKMGSLVLATSNKSEIAVGYGTLYGDMAGGFAPLKDCSKTLVYQLADYRNGISLAIPERVITREPTAELRENQKDSDSLPDYQILDKILEAFVEKDFSIEQIVKLGFDSEVVKKIIDLVKKNEYKRKQAPPGVKISQRAFGRDWRYPITSDY